MLALVLCVMASIWLMADFACAQEKEDPVITYHVPDDLNILDEYFYLDAQTVNCAADLTYESPFPEFLEADPDGRVNIRYHAAGFRSCIFINVPETETTKEKQFTVYISVDWVPQTITCKSRYSTTMGKPVRINASAVGDLSYKSSDVSTATVYSAGRVTFKHPGTVTIHIRAEDTGIYWFATKDVKVSCKMTAPALKVTRPRRGCAKLTWGKVGGAQKYLIYVKYPGKKKYRQVASRSKKIKSVTHKNLKRGRKYSYKVRACLTSGDKVYYGPFSKARTVKIR